MEKKQENEKIKFIETLMAAYRELSFENKIKLNELAISVYKKYNKDSNLEVKNDLNTNSDTNETAADNNIQNQTEIKKASLNDSNQNINIAKLDENEKNNEHGQINKKSASIFLRGLMSLSKIRFF